MRGKIRSLFRSKRLLSSAACVPLLICHAFASAGELGPPIARTDGKGGVIVDIPIKVSAEELASLVVGVRGDASCAECKAPDLRATVQHSETGSRHILRIQGPMPKDRSFLEFQAWIAWGAEGLQSGDLRNYKVNLSPLLRSSDSPWNAERSTGARNAAAADREHADSVPPSGMVGFGVVEAEKFLADWSAAWAARDIGRYLQFYAEDFRPPSGASRAEWEKGRRQRIAAGRGTLQIDIGDLEIEVVTADSVKLRFEQRYRSKAYASVGSKSLILVLREGAWKIAAETIENEKPLPL